MVAGILIYIIPAVGNQGQQLATRMPEYIERAQALIDQTIANANVSPSCQSFNDLRIRQRATPFNGYLATAIDEGIAWLQTKLPDMAVAAGTFLQRSVGGFLGVFGFLLSLVLVPIFFFLSQGRPRDF